MACQVRATLPLSPRVNSAATVTSGSNLTVQTVTSQAALDITGGSFQVTSGASAIDAALTVGAGASLTATGAGTSFTASGTTVIDDANLFAAAGASLSLPGVTSYANEVDSTTTLSASGMGSVLSLPNLASMTATTSSDYYAGAFSLTQVQALAGGDVEMPALTQISGGPIQLSSDGTGSVLNISALTSFTGVHTGQGHDSTLQATNSGDVQDNDLTTLSDVDLTLDGTGTFSYSQITSFTGATLNLPAGTFTFGQLTDADGSTFPSVNGLTLNLPAATSANGASFTVGSGETLTLPALTSIDDANFAVSGGAMVSLPGVTSYANEVDSTTTLSASGMGSVLSLPNLASMTATTSSDYYAGAFSLTQVQALAGGDVEMPALTQISGGPIQLSSDGTGSVLNISALTSFTGVHTGQGHDSTLQATNSGDVQDNDLTTLSDVDLTLDGTGTFSYSQITSFTGATLNLPAGTFTFGQLTDADGSTFPSVNGLTLNLPAATSANGASFTVGSGETLTLPALTSIDDANFAVSGGAMVSLPGVTSYANEVDSTTTLSASGMGSVLSLPNLASMTATTSSDYYAGAFSLTQVQALAGGDVEMPALTQISGGPFQLTSDGAGSVLNISALTSFTGVHTGQGHDSTLQATNSGDVQDNDLTTLSDVDLTLDGTGTFSYSQITSFTGATLNLPAGTFTFGQLTDADGSTFPSVNGLTLNLPAATSANGASFTVGSGETLTLPALTSIDDANFAVSGGAMVSLPGVTSYANEVDSTTTLSASGMGSVLSLPNLASMTATTSSDYYAGAFSLTQVQALAGGDVEMPALTQISGGPIQLSSDGTGSVLNISALTSFTGVHTGQGHDSTLQATNSGDVQDNDLTTLSDVDLTLDGTGTFSYSQITSFTGGSITIPGGTFDFSSLTDADGSGFTVNGGSLSLPQLTRAVGASFVANGAIALTSGSFDLQGSTVNISSTASLQVGTLNLGAGSNLAGAGTLTGNLVNGGSVTPAGQITVTGTYTQTGTGALNIALGGLQAVTQYSQLNVDGTASLGGLLNVSLANGFAPALGNTFQIINFASSTKLFAFYSGLNVGNNLEFDPSLSPTALTLMTDKAVQIALTTAPQTVLAGQPSGMITLDLLDQNGNPTTAGAGGVIVVLATTSSGGAFLDTNGQPLPTAAITFRGDRHR